MNMHPKTQPRHLVLIVGDQLNVNSTAFDGFDPKQDAIWMAEVTGEATQVWSHKARIAIFLAAMRQFRDELRNRGVTVHYTGVVRVAGSSPRRPPAPTRVRSRLCTGTC